MKRKLSILSDLKADLFRLNKLKSDLHKFVQLLVNNRNNFSDEVWDEHIAHYRISYQSPIENLLHLVRFRFNTFKKHCRDVKRSRKLRKQNHIVHKQLCIEQINSISQKISEKSNCNVDCQEQRQIDLLNLNDAKLMLDKINLKKINLVCLLNKINALVKYREVCQNENTKNDFLITNSSDCSRFQIEIQKLKQKLSDQIRKNNREEIFIKNLFDYENLKEKVTKQKVNIDKVNNLINSKNIRTLPYLSKNRIDYRKQRKNWSKYKSLNKSTNVLSLTLNSQCNKQAWFKYSVKHI